MLSAFRGATPLLKSNSKTLKLMQRLPKSANPAEVKISLATVWLLLIQGCWSSHKSLIFKYLLFLAPAKKYFKHRLSTRF